MALDAIATYHRIRCLFRDRLLAWKEILEMTWQTRLADAIDDAVAEGAGISDIEQAVLDATAGHFNVDGEREDPDPDAVYDIMKDKELGIDG
jgi:hypothetical protein